MPTAHKTKYIPPINIVVLIFLTLSTVWYITMTQPPPPCLPMSIEEELEIKSSESEAKRKVALVKDAAALEDDTTFWRQRMQEQEKRGVTLLEQKEVQRAKNRAYKRKQRDAVSDADKKGSEKAINRSQQKKRRANMSDDQKESERAINRSQKKKR